MEEGPVTDEFTAAHRPPKNLRETTGILRASYVVLFGDVYDGRIPALLQVYGYRRANFGDMAVVPTPEMHTPSERARRVV